MNNLSFQVMAKPVGPLCNLDCTYCYYLEKKNLYPSSAEWLMCEDILESFIKQRINSEHSDTVLFAWQGGEPMLAGIKYFKRITTLQKKYCAGKKIQNVFQTNGILIDNEWCELFKENNFLVGISIDGPEHLHNKFRKDKGKNSTFKNVMRGIETLLQNDVEFNTLTCIQRVNSYYPKEVYDFLKSIGIRFMQFIPVVGRNSNGGDYNYSDLKDSVNNWSVEPLQFGLYMTEIFDEWVRNDVGEYFVQTFENLIQSWLNAESSLCVFNKYCGDALVIEHNGDVYSCDHYVYPEYKLGNIMESPLQVLANSEKQKQFGRNKRDMLPGYCRECKFLFACNGECPKNRFLYTPDGESGLNYLCEGYKYFFDHINVYLKFLAAELVSKRPAANVMKWTKEKDSGFLSLKPGRNDECPCGSGNKYKNCCSR